METHATQNLNQIAEQEYVISVSPIVKHMRQTHAWYTGAPIRNRGKNISGPQLGAYVSHGF